ncbi:M20 family metallopeptidase [Paenibacillus agricola]|uniref:M20 family metallopeptidase n=1 Tax=Paenibacillus agricola TaxID=2716264 RepID=A0ABX0J6W8_9BACL|nr:M20 family metallopeptidase [Paenibacillus agricola]NHN32182.1 M20 family metallopeptidase [Paenibacillus agricola]
MSLIKKIETYMSEFMRLLEECVNIDSPSSSKHQNDKMADWFTHHVLRLLGGNVVRIPNPVYGDRLLCEVGTGDRQILLVGHYDTVWPLGEAGRRPFRMESGRAYGPGVYDMKAGLLQAIFAIKALQDTGRFPADKKIVLLMNSDEELGSPTSREWIEEQARQAESAFVLEPPMEPNGALKTARKGSGRYRLVVRGISAHAGVDPQNGISAIEEMAIQIQRLHALTNFNRGTTVNVGIVHGGIGRNVVADFAEAEIDVRVTSSEEAGKLEKSLEGFAASLPGAQVELTGGMMRPPMEPTEQSHSLFRLARDIAKLSYSYPLEEAQTGGVSDGNFTASMGTPTLDGLGARGDHAHALDEYVVIDEIPFRTALLSELIVRS